MKLVLIAFAVILLCTGLAALDYMLPSHQDTQYSHKILERDTNPGYARPDTLDYQFSIAPVNLLHSYYDYMIGSYNNIPLWKNPDPDYGGYFMTFHGKRTANGQRRMFYTYIDDNGVVEPMTDPLWPMAWEGYPSLAIDNVVGKPMYAWHGNYDGDTDPENEVVFVYDAYLFGAAGLLSYPVTIIDNPCALPAPYNTIDNEYIWPSVQTGPSPVAGMRRVYVLARNYKTHTVWSSENVRIAYADFNTQMLENNATLTWNYTSIPTLDAWNHDASMFRRMSGSFVVGNDGSIYYIGYHVTSNPVTDDTVEEPDLDVFSCDNFGAGNWSRVTFNSRYTGWNPREDYGTGNGYFKLTDGVTPVPDASLKWKVMNSGHFNAVMDETNARIHMPALFSLYFTEQVDGVLQQYTFPTFHTVKDLVYNISTQDFSLREIYPKALAPYDNYLWQPWDADDDGITDEYYNNPDNPNDPRNGNPMCVTTWPFPYWDNSASGSAMMFHYNHINITQPDQYGNMAIVWQDSNRARLYNTYPTDYPELAQYCDTPEIWISCSPDYGYHWSEPYSLNKVETTELANMKPMWVYPVNQVKGLGGNTPGFEGKLALMFFDDVTWGAYVIEGPIIRNGEGYVRFMELLFAPVQANEDQIAPTISVLQQNHPNPFHSETSISFTLSKDSPVNLSIYNVKGQLVKTLANGLTKKGENTYNWDGTDGNGRSVSSGLYFFKLNSEGKTETRKMMLIK